MRDFKPRGHARTARIAAPYVLFVCLISVNLSLAGDQSQLPQIASQIASSTPRQLGEQPPEMGFVPPPGDLSHIRAPMAGPHLALAARFDWREAGKVTSVKNQGSCGSCYAFAAIANVESKLLIDGAGTFDFSENNAKECEWFGSSCNGGNDWIVAHYLSTTGTVLEACDPYVASNVACNDGCPYQKTLLDWRVISGSAVPSVDVLKSYIQTYGPIYTAMYGGNRDAWYSEFQRYNGSYTLYYNGTQAPNHAVLIVGWDDNLVHAGGKGAWIVKNSWGLSWGGTCGYGPERGYFTIAYGSARIGSYSSFLYDWQDYDSNGSLMYYDEGGYTGSVGYGTTTIWGMCKFIPSRDYIIERVEFWTLDATTDVDIYIYDGFDGSRVSNLLASRLDNSFDLPGYHSVELASPLRVTANDDVYVVLKITDASSIFPMAFDIVGPKTPGGCYLSPAGASYTQFGNGDLGIRLRVANSLRCDQLTQVPTITSIADVPADRGGYVDVTWRRSTFDSEISTPKIKMYRIWRKRNEVVPSGTILGSGNGPEPEGPYEVGPTGLAWEVIGTVPATGECCYSFTAPTLCNATGRDTCWTYFYVSAQTGMLGEHFASPVVRGYSVDNGGMLTPPEGDADQTGPDKAADFKTALSVPEPNPAVDGFLLRFELDRTDRIHLGVYDVRGRQVASLLDGLTDAGPRVVRWDPGRDGTATPAPGLYFVRLVTTSEVHTVKLMLVR